MKMRLLAGLLAIAGALLQGQAFAAGDRVVAIVNDQVITLGQLQDRTELSARQTGVKQDDPRRNALMKQTLGTLIDEELQRQFAAGKDIAPLKQDIEKAKDDASTAIGAAKWKDLTHGLEKAAEQKIAAELLWQKIQARYVRPQVEVSTAEADKLIEELSKGRHVLEREISVIMLGAKDTAADKELVARIKDIREKIVTGGGDFREEAKANSDDPSAVSGGSLGWFGAGELNPKLEEALGAMKPGDVSQPIRTPLGWYLVKLDNVRTTKPVASTQPVTLYELFLLSARVSGTEQVKMFGNKMDEAVKALGKDADVRAYFEKKQYAGTFDDSSALGMVNVSDLQPEVAKAVTSAKAGTWTDAVNVGGVVARLFVAGSQQSLPKNLQATRERVMDNLAGQRGELASRRFMRELRQKAFVDVRL